MIVLKSNRALTTKAMMPLLPGRSESAIQTKRNHTGWTRIAVTRWSEIEDRKLRRRAQTMCATSVSQLMPGRTVSSVKSRGELLGIKFLARSKPLVQTGDHLIDAVRQRAHEDGLSVMALDRELGTGGYFSSDCMVAAKRGIKGKFEKVARAVEFFGGELTINWKDE